MYTRSIRIHKEKIERVNVRFSVAEHGKDVVGGNDTSHSKMAIVRIENPES